MRAALDPNRRGPVAMMQVLVLLAVCTTFACSAERRQLLLLPPPVVALYDGERRPRSEVAVVEVKVHQEKNKNSFWSLSTKKSGGNVTPFDVDGIPYQASSRGIVGYPPDSELELLPGLHRLTVSWLLKEGDEFSGGTQYSATKEVEFLGEAGKRYQFSVLFEQNVAQQIFGPSRGTLSAVILGNTVGRLVGGVGELTISIVEVHD